MVELIQKVVGSNLEGSKDQMNGMRNEMKINNNEHNGADKDFNLSTKRLFTFNLCTKCLFTFNLSTKRLFTFNLSTKCLFFFNLSTKRLFTFNLSTRCLFTFNLSSKGHEHKPSLNGSVPALARVALNIYIKS